MKKTIVLFFCFLCFGTLLPLAGYWLGGAAATRTVTALPIVSKPTQSPQNNNQNSNFTPIPSNTPNNAVNTTPNPWWLEVPAQTSVPAPSAHCTPTSVPSSTPSSMQRPTKQFAPLLIWDEGSDIVLTVSVRDYLIGAVASELPITWPDAALKAQAIASHSYILYCKANAPNPQNGTYLNTDPARRQGFMTNEVLRSYWGEDYTQNYARLSALIDQVLDVVVVYDDAVAATSYFSCCNGKTEASEVVWGEALPYLCSVDSSADTAADGYETTVSYTAAEVCNILSTVFWVSTDGYAPGSYFGTAQLTDAGNVARMPICGISISGTDLRTAFALRSACFTVQYDIENDLFTFTTQGYGHGVGLSQWGAKFMADTGSEYSEILAHYYTGTTLGSAASFEPQPTL